MPLPILTYSDFGVGFHRIGQSTKDEIQLAAYIEMYEKCILEDLLGCELAALYIADLDADPREQRFLDLEAAFCLENLHCTCEEYKSAGIKEMLKCFIFFYYMRDVRFKATNTGVVSVQHEVSDWAGASGSSAVVGRRFNQAMETYKAIQNKVKMDSTLYPEYAGKERDYLISF